MYDTHLCKSQTPEPGDATFQWTLGTGHRQAVSLGLKYFAWQKDFIHALDWTTPNLARRPSMFSDGLEIPNTVFSCNVLTVARLWLKDC